MPLENAEIMGSVECRAFAYAVGCVTDTGYNIERCAMAAAGAAAVSLVAGFAANTTAPDNAEDHEHDQHDEL